MKQYNVSGWSFNADVIDGFKNLKKLQEHINKLEIFEPEKREENIKLLWELRLASTGEAQAKEE